MKTFVLVPAYNCAHFLPELIRRLSLVLDPSSIIIVDDASTDNTFEVASSFPGVSVVQNKNNLGYGGTSNRLYELASSYGAEMTVNVHGDLGHSPEDAPKVIDMLSSGDYDIIIGSRLLYIKQELSRVGWIKLFFSPDPGKMPISRLLGHLILTKFQNFCAGTRLNGFHEGMRACNGQVIDWAVKTELPLWYDYDSEFLGRAAIAGFRIGECPIRPSYSKDVVTCAPTFRYGLRIIKQSLKFLILRLKTRIRGLAGLVGKV